MNKLQWIAGFSTTALLLVGCANGDRASQQPTAPTASPAATQATQPAPSKPATQQQAFSRPVVPPVPVKRTVSVPGLVEPTNATARVPQIPSGRRDPFAAVVTTPVVVPAPYTAARPVPKLAPVPKSVTSAPAPQVEIAAAPAPAPVITPAALPQLQPSSGAISALPLPPAPVPVSPTSLASEVEVTGVMQVGETVSAIVKVPSEATSRYVRAGEYLANGKILVKRIELGDREEPIVVLEQNGVEIVKAVGSNNNTVARAF